MDSQLRRHLGAPLPSPDAPRQPQGGTHSRGRVPPGRSRPCPEPGRREVYSHTVASYQTANGSALPFPSLSLSHHSKIHGQ